MEYWQLIRSCTPGIFAFPRRKRKRAHSSDLFKFRKTFALFCFHSKCSLDFLSMCGDLNTVYLLRFMGNETKFEKDGRGCEMVLQFEIAVPGKRWLYPDLLVFCANSARVLLFTAGSAPVEPLVGKWEPLLVSTFLMYRSIASIANLLLLIETRS